MQKARFTGEPTTSNLRPTRSQSAKGTLKVHLQPELSPRPKRKGFTSSTAALLLIVGSLLLVPRRSSSFLTPAAPAGHNTYTTHFSRAENPISEGGKWQNGQADGLDWTDVRAASGMACGTEPGGHRPAPQKYDDSTALLTGHWGPNQTVQATVRAVNPNQDGKIWEEVELRLRSSMSPHSCTGYEVMFRCAKIPQAYCNIARWDGPLGKYTMLKETHGAKFGVKTGDVVKATMIGNVLTVYINGERMVQVSDDKFADGNPGIGFFLDGATGVMGDYGFTSFSASDQ